MPSRQDQLHSYQYSMQRVVAALVTHDADPQRSPMRRAGTTALISVLIASVAVVGAAVYGMLTGQGTIDMANPGVVFQEKGTGARFVYVEADKQMHPVLNYTSGLLLSTAAAPALQSVSTEKLASIPLGAPLGIENAPDSLPKAGALLTHRWSVCTDNSGPGNSSESTLLIGDQLTDGTLAGNTGLLVHDQTDQTFLVVGNRKFEMLKDQVDHVKGALGWNAQTAWPVSTAWINAVPAGPVLKPPTFPPASGPSAIPNVRLGQVITDGTQFSLMLPDGPASLTPMQARLLQTVPSVGQPIKLANFGGLPKPSQTKISDAGEPAGLPATVPDLVAAPPTKVCISLPIISPSDPAKPDDPDSRTEVRIDPNAPVGVAVTGASVAVGANRVNLVHIARGQGALIAGAASATAPASTGTVAVVTDTGRGYPLADRTVMAKLGYVDTQMLHIPSGLFSILPLGPTLGPAAAREVVAPSR